MYLFLGCVCGAVTLVPAPCTAADEASRLFAVTFSSRQLIEIDPQTGEGTLVANLPAGAAPYDLVSWNGRLMLFSPTFVLRDLDPVTGAFTATNQFDPGMLCGDEPCSGEGAVALRPNGTGLVTWSMNEAGTLGSFRMDPPAFLPVGMAGGLQPSMDGMALDEEGILYGLSQGAAPSLYQILPPSGATILVGTNEVLLPAATVGGMAISPDGTLYAAVGSTSASLLFRMDKETGAATVIGNIGFPRVSGLAFHSLPPGPLTIARQDAGLRITWPHRNGGRLQVSLNDGTNWMDTAFGVMTNGTEATTEFISFAPRAWFRLER